MSLEHETIAPFLTFFGQAEEAMAFYLSLFDHSEVLSIKRYGANEGGAEGSVLHATFMLNGQKFMCSDSPPVHNWAFTPAISLAITCTAEDQIDRLFTALSQDGAILMPLAAYPFSEKFAWVNDRYGVSWQLMLQR